MLPQTSLHQLLGPLNLSANVHQEVPVVPQQPFQLVLDALGRVFDILGGSAEFFHFDVGDDDAGGLSAEREGLVVHHSGLGQGLLGTGQGTVVKGIELVHVTVQILKYMGYEVQILKYMGYEVQILKYMGYEVQILKYVGYEVQILKYMGYEVQILKYMGYEVQILKYMGYEG